MSREIKFKAWDHDNNKMIYWTLNDLLVRFGDPKYQYNVEDRPSPLFNWLEYTGLKDDNGKEIYEKDFVKLTIRGVKIESVYGIVKMIEGCWCIDDEKLEESIELKRANYGIELYSNIYKNPELLNKEGE